MLKRLILMSSSFAILSSAGPAPAAAAEEQGCRTAESICTEGGQCCSKLCYNPQNGDASTCK